MQLAIWRTAIVGALLTVATGCATAPRQRPITWDVLKWKTADAVTAAPLIDKGDVVLRGQDLRTRTTYSVPVTVEFETQPEKHQTDGGIFSCAFVPVDQPADAEPEQYVAVMLQYSSSGETLVVMRRSGKPHHDEAILGQPITHPAGQPYRLKIEATKDGLRITLNGQEYQVPAARVSYNKFHVEFSVVPVTDSWRIHNFAIR